MDLSKQPDLSSIFDSLPDSLVITDEQGRIVYVSKSFERHFGYQSEEVIGEGLGFLITDEERARHAEAYAHFIKNPQPKLVEQKGGMLARRKNGETFPSEVHVNPVKTNDGLFIVASIRDVTDRHHVDQLLREQKEKQKVEQELSELLADQLNIFATIPDVILKLDSEQSLICWNERLEQITGFSQQKLRKLTFSHLFKDDETQFIHGVIKDVFVSGNGQFDAHLQTENGASLYHFNTKVMTNDKGDTVGLICVGRDVSRQRLLENALVKINVPFTGVMGTEFLKNMVELLASVLGVKGVCLATEQADQVDILKPKAFYWDKQFLDLSDFNPKGSICDLIMQDGTQYFTKKVREKFPDDVLLAQTNAESLIGVRLVDMYDRPLGVLLALDSNTIKDRVIVKTVMTVYAQRI
ncbi:MAG: PAS domain S-box protein, partial [Gammaproteobacteria bacterium]|nr:PAS domain S-box protein [Gammaproteobacteria bacterium]